jgi:hypothetical protein
MALNVSLGATRFGQLSGHFGNHMLTLGSSQRGHLADLRKLWIQASDARYAHLSQ